MASRPELPAKEVNFNQEKSSVTTYRAQSNLLVRLFLFLLRDSWGVLVTASILPFFVGAVISQPNTGFRWHLFAPVSGIYIIASWLYFFGDIDQFSSKHPLPQQEYFGRYLKTHNLLVAIALGLIVGLWFEGASLIALGLLGTSIVMGRILVLKPQGVFLLIMQTLILALFCSILAILGVYTQQDKIMIETALLGLAPALPGSAAIVIKYYSVFESSGWARCRFVTTKKGEKVKRPGPASLVLSLYALFLPAFIFWLAVLDWIPPGFFWIMFVILYGAKTLGPFTESEEVDPLMWPKMKLATLLTSIAMFIVGAMSRG